MNKENTRLMFLNTLTSTHSGSGTELSYIDLPIQREAVTEFPKFEASSLKGSIRHAMYDKGFDIKEYFGFDEASSMTASKIAFSDAKILFFPVKSVTGIFAWITCPYVLERFKEDSKLLCDKPVELTIPPIESGDIYLSNNSKLEIPNGKVMLEENVFNVKQKFDLFTVFKDRLQSIVINKNWFKTHVAIVSDDDFKYFVKYSTEINERIRIDPETGTAKEGALFSEEYLPSDCILYSMVFYQEKQKKDNITFDIFIKNFNDLQMFQLGADSTLGKGFINAKIVNDANQSKVGDAK